jgi:hypothetical protein
MTEPSLLTLRCSCGSPDILALRPGVDPERLGAVHIFTREDPLVTVGEPDVGYCRTCWFKRFGRAVA